MYPSGELLMDRDGNFFGTTLSGTLFEFTPNQSGGWDFKVLCNCSATYSYGSLVMDASGSMYASTYWGEVYKYSQNSGIWTSSRIYQFSGDPGSGPSPLALDASGNLYGTYGAGGAHNQGFVFQLTPGTGLNWSINDLHDFKGTDGAVSATNEAETQLGALILDGKGNLYGTANQGGTSSDCPNGCGVLFELSRSSGAWTEKVLHSFTGTDGSNPDAPLMMDASGNLYGTAAEGGAKGFGVVFKASLASGKWTVSDLYSFTNTNGDGAYPNSQLIEDSGNIYGTTEAGGGSMSCTVENYNGCGAVFELRKINGSYKESVLEGFTGAGTGAFPGGVIFGTDGNLYGVAQTGGGDNRGVFFKIPR